MIYNRDKKLFEIDCDLDMHDGVTDNTIEAGLNLIPIDCPCGRKICTTEVVYPKCVGHKFKCDKFVSISQEKMDTDVYAQSLTTVKILCRGTNSFNFIMED